MVGKKPRMHKQASYDNAIGGSFEDEQPTIPYQPQGGRMRKQESYMMAVGEMSPVAEVPSTTFHIGNLPSSPRLSKLASGSLYEQELQQQQPPYQQSSGRMRKQESYLMAVGEMSPVAEVPPSNFRINKLSASPKIRKQDSYLKAIRYPTIVSMYMVYWYLSITKLYLIKVRQILMFVDMFTYKVCKFTCNIF